jgi:FkbM family methyltransferase
MLQKGLTMEISAPVKDLVKRIVPDKMLYEVKKRHYFNVLKSFKEEEEQDMALVNYLVRPGDKVLDIGANIGIYTRLLSRLAGPAGEVHSIEAVPATFGILEANVKRLGLGNVRLINCAVSDSDGTVSMEIPRFRGFYRARITDGGGEAPDIEKVKVDARRLDSLFPGTDRGFAFIKCDVEGHELSCVRGAVGLLDRDAPPWLMEIGDNPDTPGSRGRELLEIFRQRGYHVLWFDGSALRPRVPGDASVNYFLLKPRHVDRMKEGGMPYPVNL